MRGERHRTKVQVEHRKEPPQKVQGRREKERPEGLPISQQQSEPLRCPPRCPFAWRLQLHAPVPPPRRHRRTWKNPFRRCHLLTANLPPRRAGFFRGSEFRTWSPTACSRASHIFGRPPSRTASRPAACRQRAQSSGSPKQRRYRRACVSVSKCARAQTGTRQVIAFLHSSLRHGQTQPLATSTHDVDTA